jgi:hypothetical protein
VKPLVKRILIGIGGLIGLGLLGVGAFVGFHAYSFGSSLDKVYEVPAPKIERSTDPVVLARGKHLAESLAGCTNSDCHGRDLGGGKTMQIGPLGTFTGPNVSPGGLGLAYSDPELARLIRHGLKRDGRSVRFMPSHEINWLNDQELTAVISYVRTLPPVQKANGPFEVGLLGKILDRLDMIPIDVARRIDHSKVELGPGPTADAKYGSFIARQCTGCHGNSLSGGPIPGAPPELPIPLNLTTDATGLKGWTFDDFKRAMQTGVNKSGKKLDPMMPVESYSKLDDTELHALWDYLSTVPARPFGGR